MSIPNDPNQTFNLFYKGLGIKIRERIVAIQNYSEYLVEAGGESEPETLRYLEELSSEEDNLFSLLEMIGEPPCIIPF